MFDLLGVVEQLLLELNQSYVLLVVQVLWQEGCRLGLEVVFSALEVLEHLLQAVVPQPIHNVEELNIQHKQLVTTELEVLEVM